jgi:hypothetical protein
VPKVRVEEYEYELPVLLALLEELWWLLDGRLGVAVEDLCV